MAIKHDKKTSGANAIRNLQHWKTLCCVLNAAQGFFPFLAVLCGIFDALYAGRNFALSQNRTICSQTAKGHTKPRTGCTIP